MKNKHTVSSKLAIKMKRLGWEQGKTLSLWYRNAGKYTLINQVEDMRPMEFKSFDAPLASEILEKLPNIERRKLTIGVNTNFKKIKEDQEWAFGVAYLYEIDFEKEVYQMNGDTLAEALGKLWVYLKEEGLI